MWISIKRLGVLVLFIITSTILSCKNSDNKLHWEDYIITSSKPIERASNQRNDIVYFNYIIDDDLISLDTIVFKLPPESIIKKSNNPLIYALSVGHPQDTITIESTDIAEPGYPMFITIVDRVDNRTFAERQIHKEYNYTPDSLLTLKEKKEAISHAHRAIANKDQYCTHLGNEVYMCEIREGNGNLPSAEELVAIYYEAMLKKDFQSMDGNYNSENPFIILASAPDVIPAWRRALQYIYRGTRLLLIVPADQAYADREYAGIPPNSDLIFLIDLY